MIADYIFVYLILWPIILRPQVAKTRRQTIISSSSVLKREETERGLCVRKRGDTHSQQTDVIKGGVGKSQFESAHEPSPKCGDQFKSFRNLLDFSSLFVLFLRILIFIFIFICFLVFLSQFDAILDKCGR